MTFSRTWEEKWLALKALSPDISLRMREIGDWYVSHPGVEMKPSKDSVILHGVAGGGPTPEAAVDDHWRLVALEPPPAFIVLNAMHREQRRHMRWNGYMWVDLPIETITR
jgi:hypothetical protein